MIVRVAVLKTDIFRTFEERDTLSSDIVQTFQKSLQAWFEELPPETHLGSLAADHTDELSRRLVYFVHLVHLGALILLYRRLMMWYMESDQKAFTSDSDLDQVAEGIGGQGSVVAKQAIRVLQLLMSEQGLFQKSWLCVFTAYVSGAVVLHGAFLRAMRGSISDEIREDFDAAGKAIEVLEQCVSRDPMARQFHAVLTVYHGHLSDYFITSGQPYTASVAIRIQSPQDAIRNPDTRKSDDFPFVFPPDGGMLGKACRDLARILRRPLGSIPGIQVPEFAGLLSICMEEICLGLHLDWSGEHWPIQANPSQPDEALELIKGNETMTEAARGRSEA